MMLSANPGGRLSGRPAFRAFTKMPRTKRHLLSLFVCMLIAPLCLGAPGPAAAQGKSDSSKGDAARAKPSAQPPAQPALVVPNAENTVIMIRSTLLSLNDALATGNFTVFRDLASPSLREANSAGKLAQIFGNLAAQRVNLAAVAILVPKLPEPPSIDANKRLRIAGIFPGDPVQINFDLQFEAVGGQWRLFGIAVNPAKSASAAPAPAESKPVDNKKTTPPAKQGK